jgi:hypothetical protein
MIDRAKEEKTKAELERVGAEKINLENDIKTLEERGKLAGITPEIALVVAGEKGQKIAARDAAEKRGKELAGNLKTSTSKGFWSDVLSDEEGIQFHRFQIVVWTTVLGVVFLHAVWVRLAMPEFDATLLALMGISSGTYLGFKIPEK